MVCAPYRLSSPNHPLSSVSVSYPWGSSLDASTAASLSVAASVLASMLCDQGGLLSYEFQPRGGAASSDAAHAVPSAVPRAPVQQPASRSDARSHVVRMVALMATELEVCIALVSRYL